MSVVQPAQAESSSLLLESRWNDAVAAGMTPAQQLLYRSNLLGSDKRITNFGGGNTSAKIMEKDPLTGKDVQVLWVKGSGGDLGTMKLDGFATLYMDKFLSLEPFYRGSDSDSVLVPLYSHCTFNLNPRAASIDTPLHGLVDRAHVDHMHPDALIAIAAAADSKALTKEIYGDEVGWLPWIRPGYELGLALRKFTRENPRARGVVLEAHGVFTWADTAKACYENTLDVINRATLWLADKSVGKQPFGAFKTQPLPLEKRREVAAAIMPRIRGLISGTTRKVGHFDDSAAVLEFVGSEKLQALADLGTSCPDHFLRTKIWPLVLPFDAASDSVDQFAARVQPAIEKYRERYAAYYERCKRPGSPKMRDPNPVVYLVPGVGMITFAADKATARIAGEFYINAINVMRGAAAVSTYRGLPEQEAFDIEYWDLEEAKLQRMPKPKPLAGRVALITGGAGGIGLATARRLMDEGACVVLCDIDHDALHEAEAGLKKQYGNDVVSSCWVDVTREDAVIASFRDAAWKFGGLDICISNAGIASASPVDQTSLATWQKNMDILSTGYFLVARQTFQLLKAQGIGGSIVFIGSKNALAASPGAAAYCTAKAAELHLARCLALEGAPAGIRVNVVNPDAVLRGSRIWQGEWAQQRAEQYKTSTDELETIYRERSLLKRSVFPEDVAEAVAFFASERAAKSTGNIINVDAGNAAAFTR
ncbi:bifunctional rhamnulose-1-phosphate aldolase/short-chain dehydrogenase [Steroidobacter sp. S1-65]|uniref:Bifunctional rhamnulose-1-phosphate aldolase/short-chain dehydrogenase n=1 Tax=Steroidobacter gossypii TaxID=2805490 RepID=A0ABS1WSC1_9GAMM|nr:bifunctional rhamnulose-1-phosphate aldolase/short-chain dehydrogenase [Steroidobacter gossypii]MBM0103867.1 bifunctional rhamnulose-1-phosphate aldolase/short-chain dehydrogenase [Steroidobacter gossypii]